MIPQKPPKWQAFGKIVKKFEDTGVGTNIETSVHHSFAWFAENIAIVSESIAEDPNVLIPSRSHRRIYTYIHKKARFSVRRCDWTPLLRKRRLWPIKNTTWRIQYL